MSSLIIENIGSSSMKVSWPDEADDIVYQLDVLNNVQEEIMSIETTDKSVELNDLYSGTEYMIKLSRPVSLAKITNLRISQSSNSWLSVIELILKDENNVEIPSTNFEISSSATHVRGPATQAMDGNGDSTSHWSVGAMMRGYAGATIRGSTSGSYWNASFINPVSLSSITLYSDSSYSFSTSVKLTLTTSNDQSTSYTLGNNYRVDGKSTHEYIPVDLNE